MMAGLPKSTSKKGSMAATTRGSTGVVAWQSRYTGFDRGCRGDRGAESAAGIAPSIVTRARSRNQRPPEINKDPPRGSLLSQMNRGPVCAGALPLPVNAEVHDVVAEPGAMGIKPRRIDDILHLVGR